jgi:hypothetical protein
MTEVAAVVSEDHPHMSASLTSYAAHLLAQGDTATLDMNLEGINSPVEESNHGVGETELLSTTTPIALLPKAREIIEEEIPTDHAVPTPITIPASGIATPSTPQLNHRDHQNSIEVLILLAPKLC